MCTPPVMRDFVERLLPKAMISGRGYGTEPSRRLIWDPVDIDIVVPVDILIAIRCTRVPRIVIREREMSMVLRGDVEYNTSLRDRFGEISSGTCTQLHSHVVYYNLQHLSFASFSLFSNNPNRDHHLDRASIPYA